MHSMSWTMRWRPAIARHPRLDAEVARDEQALAAARQSVVADAGRGLGARWVAMNELTSASAGTLVLRLLTIAFFALLYLLPLILRQWRGETTHDRHTTARADRERAELEADTAIAIKRAEVRREAEIMWAEHQLTQARLAIEAQAEIDREQQRRRVVEALEGPAGPRQSSVDAYLRARGGRHVPADRRRSRGSQPGSRRIACFSRATPRRPRRTCRHTSSHSREVEPHTGRGSPSIPSIPDATKTAARWIRPLVPPFVGRVIDNTTQLTSRCAPRVRCSKTSRRSRSRSSAPARSRSTPRAPTSGNNRSTAAEAAEAPAGPSRIESSRGERHRPDQGPDEPSLRPGAVGGSTPQRPGQPVAEVGRGRR